MKTQTVHTMKTKFGSLIAIAFFAVIPNLASLKAQDAATPNHSLQVKCVEKATNHITFQLDLHNENGDLYFLSVKDEDGIVLYTEKIKDKDFSRRFQWNKEYNSPRKLVFTLTGDKMRKEQVVEVNSTYQLVQDVVISRL